MNIILFLLLLLLLLFTQDVSRDYKNYKKSDELL